MATTTRLGMTLLEEAQQGKVLGIDAALNAIDAAIGALGLANAFTNTNTFVGPVGIGQATPTARLHISRTAAAANPTNPTYLKVVGVADTAMAASTEVNDLLFDLSATLQFATGALTTQRTARYRRRTYSFVGASVIATAATLALEGAPVAGTNATITLAYALWVESGLCRFDGNVEVNGQISCAQLAGIGVPLKLNALIYTWPSDANHTLTPTEASSPYIDIQTGVVTAQRDLIFPLGAGNLVCVRNRNAQAVRVIGSSGAGIVIASNRITWLISSGSNVTRVSAEIDPTV